MRKLLFLLPIFFYSCLPPQAKQNDIKYLKEFYSKSYLDSVSLEIDKLGLNPNQTLVDIGTGNTFFTCEIARKYPKMNFILEDIYELQTFNGKLKTINWIANNNEHCTALKGRSKFVTGKKSSLPLESNSYTQILLRKTFHEIKTPEIMVKELHRILKREGKVIIVDIEPAYPNEKDSGCGFTYIPEKQMIKYFSNFNHLGTEYIEEDGTKRYIASFQK